MAQLVEQRIRNAQVIGSNPIISSKQRDTRKGVPLFGAFRRFNLKRPYSLKISAQLEPFPRLAQQGDSNPDHQRHAKHGVCCAGST